MKFILVEKINAEKGRVKLIHHFPEQLTEEEKEGGFLVENVDNPKYIDGKIAVAYYLYKKNLVIYEYENENIQSNEIQLMQNKLAKKDLAIEQLQKDLADLTRQIAFGGM